MMKAKIKGYKYYKNILKSLPSLFINWVVLCIAQYKYISCLKNPVQKYRDKTLLPPYTLPIYENEKLIAIYQTLPYQEFSKSVFSKYTA